MRLLRGAAAATLSLIHDVANAQQKLPLYDVPTFSDVITVQQTNVTI
jgi:hypothetical protein